MYQWNGGVGQGRQVEPVSDTAMHAAGPAGDCGVHACMQRGPSGCRGLRALFVRRLRVDVARRAACQWECQWERGGL